MKLTSLGINKHELSHNGRLLLFSHYPNPVALHIPQPQPSSYMISDTYLTSSSLRHINEWFASLDVPPERVHSISLPDMIRLWETR